MKCLLFFNVDAISSIYRVNEISSLSDELMAELGRDEKTLEKLGAQDLTPNEVMIQLYLLFND